MALPGGGGRDGSGNPLSASGENLLDPVPAESVDEGGDKLLGLLLPLVQLVVHPGPDLVHLPSRQIMFVLP